MILLFKKIIDHKLALSFLLIILVLSSFGIIILEGLFTLGQLSKSIYKHPLVVSNSSLHAALNITKMHRSMKDVVLESSLAELETALKAVEEAEATVYQQLDTIQKNILGEEGQYLEKQTRQLFINWTPIREEVVRLLKSGNRKEAILITKGKGAAHVVKLEEKMLELTSYARNKATNFLEQIVANQSRLENIVILTIACVILSLLIAFFAIYRVLKAQEVLRNEKTKLQKVLDEVKTLRGIIPICSYCKQIRDDKGLWKQMELYIRAHSSAEFSHSICPKCMEKLYSDEFPENPLNEKQ